MKQPPKSLPAVNSPKWHSRRSWDSLGYLRVRTLANPRWSRDIDRVVGMLEWDGPRTALEQPLIESAISAARAYAAMRPRPAESTEKFDSRREATWDQMLVAIDEVLELRQREHLKAVDDAGRSGRP